MKILLTFMIILLNINLSAKLFNYKKIFANNKGVSNYEKGKLKNAQQDFYNNSVKNPKDSTLHFNLGNAYYQNKEYDKAETEYQYPLRDGKFQDKSIVYQNIGNINYDKKEYKKAIENYRKSLLENPNNQDARHNYEMVSKLLKRQQKQQQNSKDSKKNKKDQDKKDQKKQNKQQEDKKKQDQQKQEQQKQEQKKKDDKKKQEQQKKIDLKKQKKKEEADKILKALMKKEKEKRKEKKQQQPAPSYKGKFW